MSQQYRTVDVDGLLHAGIWEPSGTPAGTLVAIHGVTSSHLAFAAVARALPEYRIVAPDLRGRQPHPLGLAHRLEHVAHQLAQVVVVLGHGLGPLVHHGLAPPGDP